MPIARDYLDRLCNDYPFFYPNTPNRRAVRQLAAVCEGRSTLLGGKHARTFLPALLALSAHRGDWIRSLDTWSPPDGEADEQFASLVRHILALYDLPRFLDSAWLAGLTPEGATYQDWYVYLGGGGCLRAVKGMPLPMSSRMAHHFLKAPDDFDIPSAIRYAQVVSMGGDERLARILLGTRIGTDFGDNDFWESVIRWFIAHPSLDHVHHGPIVDYLYFQRIDPSVPNSDSRVRGRPRQPLFIPPQPNLTMKGRTPESLLKAVERWHKRLGAERRGTFAEWKPSGIFPLVHVVGTGETRRVYETTELITAEELEAEGAAMEHCVATYWRRCASGQTSIWSLTVADATGHVERLLTLEVRNTPPQIVQVQAEANWEPTPDELKLLAIWGEAGGPTLSRGCLPEYQDEIEE